jgi:hypothetical protein
MLHLVISDVISRANFVSFPTPSLTAGFPCPQMAKLICSIKEPCQTLVSFIELAVHIGIPQLI